MEIMLRVNVVFLSLDLVLCAFWTDKDVALDRRRRRGQMMRAIAAARAQHTIWRNVVCVCVRVIAVIGVNICVAGHGEE